jgi:uncharacterized protein
MHAMVKPYGPVCNLDCDYCYYLSKQNLLDTDSGWKISDELLEKFIAEYIGTQNHEVVVFSWQGGESSLLGLDFFRKVVALQKRYSEPGVTIENDLQTNGTTLNDEWCRFLKEEKFLVGLSIDGPGHIHDAHRRSADGKGSFKKALSAAKLLRKHGVKFATLTVVNDKNSLKPLETYRFLRDVVGSKQMQFIPIVEPKTFRDTAPQFWPREDFIKRDDPRTDPAHENSIVETWCVESDAYGDFLITVFDEWFSQDYGKIFVPFFDSAVEQWMGRPSPLCIFSPICGKGLALEHDGSVYSCDHYVYPEYKLGNINDTALVDMAFSDKQQAFGYGKDKTLPLDCRVCPYLFACSGECPKNRILLADSGEPGLNYLCRGLFKYFEHIDPYIREIVQSLGYEVKANLSGNN